MKLSEHRKLLEDITEDVLKNMTSSELAEYELRRMEFNAYKVAEEVEFRIDGAPVPGGGT